MPTHATPGHPYLSQSIHVTVNPIYKSKDANRPQSIDPTKLPLLQRPQTGVIQSNQTNVQSAREERAKTAPPGYKTAPKIDHNRRLITNNFVQLTPWCRDMYSWFTPDRSQGVWYDDEDFDRYRRWAINDRLPAGRIFHTNVGLMPNYSGYVPGQKFRFSRTWARETTNARMIGVPRKWESTSYFQDRPIGVNLLLLHI